jgi:hypothetical protein
MNGTERGPRRSENRPPGKVALVLFMSAAGCLSEPDEPDEPDFALFSTTQSKVKLAGVRDKGSFYGTLWSPVAPVA